MSKFNVGDKVRIRPEFCRQTVGVLKERGWVVTFTQTDGNCILQHGGRGGPIRTVPAEQCAPDIDLPYDPPTPRKTLAEKELEVLQADPIRRRWQELLGPSEPVTATDPSTEDVQTYLDARKAVVDPLIHPIKETPGLRKWLEPGNYLLIPKGITHTHRGGVVLEFEAVASDRDDVKPGDRVSHHYRLPEFAPPNLGPLLRGNPDMVTAKVMLRQTKSNRTLTYVEWGEEARAYASDRPGPEAPKAFKVGDRVRLTASSTFSGAKIGAMGIVTRVLPEDGYQIRWDDECGYSSEPRASLEPYPATLQKWAKCYEEANEAYERVTGRKFVDATKSFFQAEEAEAIVEAEKRVAEHIAADKKDPYCNERTLVQVAGFKTGDRVFRLKASNLNSRQEGVIREISAPVRNGKVQMAEAFASIDHDDGSSCCGGAGSVLYSYRPILEVKPPKTGTCTFDE
jgi:hypothetical protein